MISTYWGPSGYHWNDCWLKNPKNALPGCDNTSKRRPTSQLSQVPRNQIYAQPSFKDYAPKSTPKSHWQGSKSNSTVGRFQLSYLSYRKFGIFAAPPFKGEPGQGRRKKRAGDTAGAKRPQFFFQRAKKRNPHGARRPGKHPQPANETAQPNGHPKSETHTRKGTPKRPNSKQTPPRRAKRRHHRHDQRATDGRAKRARTRERQNRTNTRKRGDSRDDNAEANESGHTPGGRNQRPDAAAGQPQPETQPKKKTKTTHRAGGRGATTKPTRRRERESDGKTKDTTHRPTPGATTHRSEQASEKKKRRGNQQTPHHTARTKRESAQRHTPERSDETRRQNTQAERGGPTTTRKQGNGATPEQPTRETDKIDKQPTSGSEGQRGARQNRRRHRGREAAAIFIFQEKDGPQRTHHLDDPAHTTINRIYHQFLFHDMWLRLTTIELVRTWRW